MACDAGFFRQQARDRRRRVWLRRRSLSRTSAEVLDRERRRSPHMRGSTNGPPKSTRAKASRSVWPSLAFCAGVLTSRRLRESEELLGYRDTTQYRGQDQTVHTVACIAANGAKCRQMSPSTIRYLSSCGAVKAGPTRWFLMFARACAREEESREPT
jgi:hypothetical protein